MRARTQSAEISRRRFGMLCAALSGGSARAFAQASAADAPLVDKPDDPYFAGFNPKPAPALPYLVLNPGDSVVLCGDSITEADKYSRILETYFTLCMPQLGLTFRNCGKGGETAPQFLARMNQECLRFSPTLATLCYGMNDSGYVPASPARTQAFHDAYTAVQQRFQDAGVRVLLGSPGCIGQVPPWDFVQQAGVKSDVDLNQNLCGLRDQSVDIAIQNGIPFADVFWIMFTARYYSLKRRGPAYTLCGTTDGIHPDWAGHVVMAYAFLRMMGLDGNLGSISIDLTAGLATAEGGHEIVSFDGVTATIRSTRYPFCADGPLDRYTSVRSGMEFVPFQSQLNRLMLRVHGATSMCRVSWGDTVRRYSGADLETGINLAEEFSPTPFQPAFQAVDNLVLAKQTNERDLIWKVFYFGYDETKIAQYEMQRAALMQAIQSAFVPVVHTIRVEAIQP